MVHAVRRVAVAALIAVLSAPAHGEPKCKASNTCPAFKCDAAGEMFHCKAKNIDGLWPRWELKGRYVAWGLSGDPDVADFKAYAPKKWTGIEMFVQTDENEAWLVRGGEVKLWRGKAVFRCIANAACSGKPK